MLLFAYYHYCSVYVIIYLIYNGQLLFHLPFIQTYFSDFKLQKQQMNFKLKKMGSNVTFSGKFYEIFATEQKPAHTENLKKNKTFRNL